MKNSDTSDEDLPGLRLFKEGGMEERYMTFIDTGGDGLHFSLPEAQAHLQEIVRHPELSPLLFP